MYVAVCSKSAVADIIINPWHACAARVTVVILCVCLSVCLRLFSDYRLRGSLCAIPTSSVLQGHEKQCSDFAETTAFERYGVKTSEKANMHNEHWLTSTAFSPFGASWMN